MVVPEGSSMKPRISVVINTLNEEKNLPYALRSVRTWADEIIVVDMHSEDRTVEIAREYGAKVFLFERVGFVEPARAFAVEQATSEWIFILDADEVIPQPLSVKLMEIAAQDAADIVSIAWLNHLSGASIFHTGWGPNEERHPRFFKKNKLVLSARVHAGIHPVNGTRILNLPYSDMIAVRHFCYLDWRHLIDKINRYTTVEAQQAFERGEHASKIKTVAYALFEFVNRFIRKQGYKDGWRGFYLAGLMMSYHVAIQAKLQELESTGGREKVQLHYQSEAERLLGKYYAGKE